MAARTREQAAMCAPCRAARVAAVRASGLSRCPRHRTAVTAPRACGFASRSATTPRRRRRDGGGAAARESMMCARRRATRACAKCPRGATASPTTPAGRREGFGALSGKQSQTTQAPARAAVTDADRRRDRVLTRACAAPRWRHAACGGCLGCPDMCSQACARCGGRTVYL